MKKQPKITIFVTFLYKIIKMKHKIIFYLLLLVQLIVSCKSITIRQKEIHSKSNSFNKETENRELAPIEYVKWVRDEKNGLRVLKQEGIYIYELQYQPVEYLVVLQERSEEIEAYTLSEEIEKRGDLQYFTFKMSTTTGKGILSDRDLIIENKDIYLLSGLYQ